MKDCGSQLKHECLLFQIETGYDVSFGRYDSELHDTYYRAFARSAEDYTLLLKRVPNHGLDCLMADGASKEEALARLREKAKTW